MQTWETLLHKFVEVGGCGDRVTVGPTPEQADEELVGGDDDLADEDSDEEDK